MADQCWWTNPKYLHVDELLVLWGAVPPTATVTTLSTTADADESTAAGGECNYCSHGVDVS
jgi:hypothetical protein